MGFPSCFILSIRVFICSRLMSLGCSIKRKFVGRWFLLWQATRGRAGLPITFYLVWKHTLPFLRSCSTRWSPFSSLQVSGVSARCPPYSPPEKHKSDFWLAFPRWCQKPEAFASIIPCIGDMQRYNLRILLDYKLIFIPIAGYFCYGCPIRCSCMVAMIDTADSVQIHADVVTSTKGNENW